MSSAPSPAWPPGCGADPAPALDQRRQIEWQGRQAGHRLVLKVHQPNLRLFGDSDSQGQYGYRLISGAYTTSAKDTIPAAGEEIIVGIAAARVLPRVRQS